MASRQLCLTRSYRFSAAHYLNSPHLSREENISLYGKCGHEAGHGHNYTLKVTLKGPPDPETGMIVNYVEMDGIIREKVLNRLDHENLNLAHCKMEIPTSENLIQEIWAWLEPCFKTPSLYKIELDETSKNGFKYAGGKEPGPSNLS